MAEKQSKAQPEPAQAQQSQGGDDAGQAEVQKTFDEAAEKGHFGETPDDTPNENYTLKGVTSGAETPETKTDK